MQLAAAQHQRHARHEYVEAYLNEAFLLTGGDLVVSVTTQGRTIGYHMARKISDPSKWFLHHLYWDHPLVYRAIDDYTNMAYGEPTRTSKCSSTCPVGVHPYMDVGSLKYE